MKHFSRRQFVGGTIATGGIGSLVMPRIWANQGVSADVDPHYFLQLYIPGGADATYLFDAKPLAMTAANLQHNVLEEEGVPFTGSNGVTCLRTSISKKLDPFLQDFSVINGVHMTTFDGHPQNASYLMTGNPFGGDAFWPLMNQGSDQLPLDFVRVGQGNFLVDVANDANAVQLSAEASIKFSGKINELGSLDIRSGSLARILQRANRIAESRGGFAVTAGAMRDGMRQMPQIGAGFTDYFQNSTSVDPNDVNKEILYTAKLIGSLYRRNITKSVVYVFNTDLSIERNIDVHAPEDAKKLPERLTRVLEETALLFSKLKEIPATRDKSIYDCTTFLIASEFGRTMRGYTGKDGKVNDGGTNHNPYVNTALIGGKGIKSGLVIGSSDLSSVAEYESKAVSNAHLQKDTRLEMVMGKPFDFDTGLTANRLPEVYDVKDYLSFPSITNTIMKIMGTPEDKFFALERNGPKAPVIGGLIV